MCAKQVFGASQVELVLKNLPGNAGDIKDVGSIPGSGRSPGGGHGKPAQYSCLENPMDREAWWSTVHKVAESWAWLKWLNMHSRILRNLYYNLHMKESESEAAQSCPTLCDPMNYSLAGSFVLGIFQTGVLEWVATSFSRGSSPPRDWTLPPTLQAHLPSELPGTLHMGWWMILPSSAAWWNSQCGQWCPVETLCLMLNA